MRLQPMRLVLSLLVAITCLTAGSAESSLGQILVIQGSAEGSWDTSQFPNRSFHDPLTGHFLISPQGTTQVRIAGTDSYEAEVQWICPIAYCPSSILFPHPFEVEAAVDLVATIGSQNGETVYCSPHGRIVEDWWLRIGRKNKLRFQHHRYKAF